MPTLFAGPAARPRHSHADTLDWLAFRLVLLGCEFTVHGPVELIDHLRSLDGRISRAITA